MLSRCTYFGSRNIVYKSRSLYASANQLQENRTRFQQRSYHVVNNNRQDFAFLRGTDFLKTRNILCSVSARSISDTSTNGTITDSAPTIDIHAFPEIPTVPAVSEISEVLATGAEPTFTALGLGGWWPMGWVQNSLEYLHIGHGIPWWGCIVIGTIVVRTLLLPLFITVQRNAAQMNNNLPQMQELQLKMTEARLRGNAVEIDRVSRELLAFMQEKGCNPIKNLMMPLAQAPIFISFFYGIRGMVSAPVESMATGGMFWFTDLTIADPYFILPAITSATLALTIELGTDGARLEASNMQIMKYFLRAIPFVVFPFTMNFPAALLCYWTSANFISLAQVAALKIDSVRSLCKIDKLVKHETAVATKKKRFVAGVKNSWNNIKLSKELEERQHLDDLNAERAAKGVQQPSGIIYKFDPTKPRSRTTKKH